MHLELRNCIIRPWLPDDAAALQRHANNRKVWANLRDLFPHPYTLADAHSFIEFVTQNELEPTFAIATASASEAIGCIGLKPGEDVHRKTAELGYWLGEAFWGRGIMKETVCAFTSWAFATYDLVRIYAEPFADNVASVRVLENAGFMCEGRLRAHVFKEGRVLDALLYAKVLLPAASDGVNR